MPIPHYLAMTAAEFFRCKPLPPKIAWMACHFSAYGTGVSNCPRQLPPGNLLILNDRTPVYGHDPKIIAAHMAQMAEDWKCAGILLDLQRPGNPQTGKIAEAICAEAPCPVAVSEYYCHGVDAAVFLSPPLHIPLTEYLAPWQGREIWLEAAIEETQFVITPEGCQTAPLACPVPAFPHAAAESFSHYHIATGENAIRFSFRRSREDVETMISKACGVSCFVGLYQQFP